MTDGETLPLPIKFELPGPKWRGLPPASRGVTNAAFLAVREGTDDFYDPTITISGDWRMDPATLDEIADESLAKLSAQADQVSLLGRKEIASDHAPAVLQNVSVTVKIGGLPTSLRQIQSITAAIDVDDDRKRIVLVYTFTCTEAQTKLYGPEFMDFLRTVEVVPDDQVTWDQ